MPETKKRPRRPTARQLAQRARRDREAAEKEFAANNFILPDRGPNYGKPQLAVDDERIADVARIVSDGLDVRTACDAVGIPAEWEQKWLSDGLADFLAGLSTPNAALYDAIRRSFAKATGDLDKMLLKADSAHAVNRLKFKLERTRSFAYALKVDTANSVDTITALADLFAAHEADPPLPVPPSRSTAPDADDEPEDSEVDPLVASAQERIRQHEQRRPADYNVAPLGYEEATS